jgi:hypothetical protein
MNKKFKYIFIAFMAMLMVTIMALVATIRNFGLHPGFFLVYVQTWFIMTPIAYVAALVAVPLAQKWTRAIVGGDSEKRA